MPFGWLGTFRQGQWQAYRSFVLNERRDASRRMAVIEAELDRVGSVTVLYATTRDEATGESVVSEQRMGFSVSQGSSLEKLVQAYVAQGGNPFDVSLFLTPDSTYLLDPEDEDSETPTQPYGGVVYPKSGDYGVGTAYEGGFLVIRKYTPSRVGGRTDLQDNTVAGAVDVSRRWVNTTIQARLHDIEAQIIKLCDLREQLLDELDDLTMAIGGTAGALPTLDQEQYDENLGVARVVAAIDAIFYDVNDDGVPDFASLNFDALESYRSLLLDAEGGEEDNTAL